MGWGSKKKRWKGSEGIGREVRGERRGGRAG